MEEYRILENSAKDGILTIKINGVNLAFNHSLFHDKDIFEEFDWDDCGVVNVKGLDMHHINGRIISTKEFKFVKDIISDLKDLYY